MTYTYSIQQLDKVSHIPMFFIVLFLDEKLILAAVFLICVRLTALVF